MTTKRYEVKLNITYTLSIPITANSIDDVVDEIEKYIKKLDDYEIVNRSSKRSFDIQEITEPKPKHNGYKKNGKPIKRSVLTSSHR